MEKLWHLLLSDPAGMLRRWLDIDWRDGFKGSVPLAVAFVVIVAGFAFWLWRRPDRRGRTQVTVRKAFGAAGAMMWQRLQQALPGHVVLIDVPLSRFISVRKAGGLGRNQRKLAEVVADYAVFRTDGTISSVVLIEENEAELSRGLLRLRRKLLDRAGVRTVGWRLSPMPSVDVVGRELNPDPGQLLALEKGSAQRV